MTLVQLRHLLSLAQTGSFSKSAAALFLTQPALSRSVRALESKFGQPLFDRVGRHNELTPFGRDVVERARELVLAADDLLASGVPAKGGEQGVLRIGMGSGPGAMLMTPLLMHVARERPRLRIEIARAATEQLVHALRERVLDVLVVDVRSMRPAPDLVRRGHPLNKARVRPRFDDLLSYPIASTPLSDEVARVLVERYGAQAHPDACVTLRCEDIPSLVEVTLRSDAVLLAIRAAAPGLVELNLQPPLAAQARFGLITLKRRTEPPGLAVVRLLMHQLLSDTAATTPNKGRAPTAVKVGLEPGD
jgi:DNA-binding transcriptional LysR family regulator